MEQTTTPPPVSPSAKKPWVEPCILIEQPLEVNAQDPVGGKPGAGIGLPPNFISPFAASGGVCP